MNLIVHPEILNKDSGGCHVWAWRSLTDKRVCRATLQGEAHGMLSGTEMGDRLRAIILDCRGYIKEMRDWQRISSENMRHLWLTDCESLVAHLKSPKNESDGERAAINRYPGTQAVTLGESRRYKSGRATTGRCVRERSSMDRHIMHGGGLLDQANATGRITEADVVW